MHHDVRSVAGHPATAPVVTWMFAQRLAGHSAAMITRALNDAEVPCPSAADPARNPHRTGAAWTLRTVAAILANPGTPAGRCETGSGPTSTWPTPLTRAWGTGRCSGGTCPEAGSSPSSWRMRRWSAKLTSSPPRTSPRRADRPGLRCAGTCWPAGGAGAGWNQRGPTASPPTGAATATPALRAQKRDDPRTPTCGRTRSSRTWRHRHPARRPREETSPDRLRPGAADRPGRSRSPGRPAPRRRHRPHLRPGQPDPARRQPRRAVGRHRKGRH